MVAKIRAIVSCSNVAMIGFSAIVLAGLPVRRRAKALALRLDDAQALGAPVLCGRVEVVPVNLLGVVWPDVSLTNVEDVTRTLNTTL